MNEHTFKEELEEMGGGFAAAEKERENNDTDC